MDDTLTRIYGWSPGTGGVHRHRIAEPLRVLGTFGNPVATGPELGDELLARYDTILAHTLHAEADTQAWQQLARIGVHRLVLDVDDWMWGPDWQPFKDHYTPEALRRLYANVSAAHVVTTPNPQIAEYLTRFNRNVWYVPNTIPAWMLDVPLPPRDRPVMAYQGSPSHLRDWTAGTIASVVKFLHRHPDWTMSWYGTTPGPELVEAFPGRIEIHPWRPDEEYFHALAAATVGIGPLRDTPFNRGKSGLRAEEYAALGIVAVLPDLPIYQPWIRDNVTGRLVHGHQTLHGVLADVAANPEHLAAMAANARQAARAWTTEAAFEGWAQAWASQ